MNEEDVIIKAKMMAKMVDDITTELYGEKIEFNLVVFHKNGASFISNLTPSEAKERMRRMNSGLSEEIEKMAHRPPRRMQ